MFSFLYHCQYSYQTWLYMWVTRRVSYKKHELPTLIEHMRSPPVFWWGPCGWSFWFLCCLIMCLWVPCCEVRYDFHIITMFGSSLHPVFCTRVRVLFTFLLVFAYSGVQHMLFSFLFFLRLVYPMLPVPLDFPFLNTPSVFSNVYLGRLVQIHDSYLFPGFFSEKNYM